MHDEYSSRSQLLFQVASWYYRHQQTMDAIAHRLGVSRPTVSRMLQQARDSGLVEITLRPPPETVMGLERHFDRHFGVRATVIESGTVDPRDGRLRVAAAAARFLEQHVVAGTVLGVSWGRTIDLVGRALVQVPRQNAVVVQLNGTASPVDDSQGPEAILARFGEAFSSKVLHFAVPAFFDKPGTREAMWLERSITRILEVQRSADVAVFGVGSVTSGVPSPVYTSRYLDESDQAELLSAGVVGDVCTVFLRADGSHDGVALNQRTTGLQPADLRRIPTRLCVVAGTDRATALRAALRAGLITHLIVDAPTAKTLADHEP